MPWLLCNIVEEMVVVEIFKSASLNRAMTTSSLVADFKSHEDQRMIADTEMNYTSFWYFFGLTSYTEVNPSILITKSFKYLVDTYHFNGEDFITRPKEEAKLNSKIRTNIPIIPI